MAGVEFLEPAGLSGRILARRSGPKNSCAAMKGLISEASLIPWLLALTAALLVLGFLTAVGCKNMTVAAAERERDAAERAMRDRVEQADGVDRAHVAGVYRGFRKI